MKLMYLIQFQIKELLRLFLLTKKIDNYYNNMNPVYEEEEKEKDTDKKIKPMIMKTRNRSFPKEIQSLKSEYDNTMISIILMKTPLGSISNAMPVYLHSLKLYNNALEFINDPLKYSMSIGGVRISKIIKAENGIKDTDISIIKSAEYVLEKVLPGMSRLKSNFNMIYAVQSRLYTKVVKYVDMCISKKLVVNRYNIVNMLDFDSEWGEIHELGRWVTNKTWLYYMKIILNSYKFCQLCGQIQSTINRKCIEPLNHALGVMYVLKDGFYRKASVNGVDIRITVIPRDNYLNQSGVLLETNKLSNLRKSHNNGVDMFRAFLDFGSKVMSHIDLRNLIFN